MIWVGHVQRRLTDVQAINDEVRPRSTSANRCVQPMDDVGRPCPTRPGQVKSDIARPGHF
ncbi:hypothetical protein H5410_026147 [Solanum commersonii]|uniref:Uncharacterized protein n=1 Tax=Solanum commersonii TaxID=4109 RepID=A0A9J5YY48_SOLCO|nr:hypothetical protein H5410_026147 [Solanum commersonii]